MIYLDAHIKIWWVEENGRLTNAQRLAISSERRQSGAIGVRTISCIEIARLVWAGLIELLTDALTWMNNLLSYPSVPLLPITPEIAVRSYILPEPFHRDPADRLLVAATLEFSCPLLTSDRRIIEYPDVTTI